MCATVQFVVPAAAICTVPWISTVWIWSVAGGAADAEERKVQKTSATKQLARPPNNSVRLIGFTCDD